MMNEWLNKMYGTAETIGAAPASDDTEKLAQAELLNQMLEAEGYDVDKLSADTIVKVANALFGADNKLKVADEMPPQFAAKAEEKKEEGKEEHEKGETKEEEKKEEEKKDEDEEKKAADELAQADFVGRMMAHAYVNELAAIEKQAQAAQAAPAPVAPTQTKTAAPTKFLDILAQQRAEEILKEAQANQPPAEDENVKLAQAVEKRALEMLTAAGYTVK